MTHLILEDAATADVSLAQRNAELEARIEQLEEELSTYTSGAQAECTDPNVIAQEREEALRVVSMLLENVGVHFWNWPCIGSSPLEISGVAPRGDNPSPEDLEDPWHAYLHPEDVAHFKSRLNTILHQPGTFDIEVRAKVLGEAYRYYVCRGTSEFIGDEMLKATGTLIDIEDRRALELKLTAASDKLNLVISGVHSGVYDWPDTTQDYIRLDDSMVELLEYGLQEVRHSEQWWWSMVHPDDCAKLMEILQHSLTTGEDFDATFRMLFKHSGYRHIRSWAKVTLDPSPARRCRLTGMILDVDDAWLATAHLNDINRQLESFAYLVAHDLGASLRHILGFATLLGEDYGHLLDKSGAGFLERIVRSGNNAVNMIEDLQLYARTGTSPLKLEEVDLNALILEIQETLSLQAVAEHVTWEVELLPVVRADETQMRMLFQNLLSNAIKFTRGRPVACITISARAVNPVEVEVSVRDTGIGFEQKDHEYLLEPFRRGHTNEEFEGTGMGLANVARIVARHGGRIAATGVVGEGAEFRVVLTGGGS